ncbi:hypothetical protein CRM22_001863, partial [Opisthorchis felineus]
SQIRILYDIAQHKAASKHPAKPTGPKAICHLLGMHKVEKRHTEKTDMVIARLIHMGMKWIAPNSIMAAFLEQMEQLFKTVDPLLDTVSTVPGSETT